MRRSADPRRRGSAGLASMGISKERDGRGTVGRAESTPGASAEADPGLEEGEEGTPKWILKGRPACGVPAVLSPRPHRTGRFQPPRPPLFGDPLRGRPLRSGLRGAFSALWARPARSGRGADVFGPSRRAPDGALRNSPAVEAAARVGRHRAPAAGPPPLRLHDPVRTRLLAGGEWRQRTMAGNRWAIIWLTYQESEAIGFGRQAGTSRRRRAHLRDGGGGRARAREL